MPRPRIIAVLAPPLVALVQGCAAPPPEERPCLRCAEVDDRDDEALLCDASWPAYEPLHGCRCAPSSPCEAACPIWCASVGVAPEEPSCTACVAAMCPGEREACDADRPL